MSGLKPAGSPVRPTAIAVGVLLTLLPALVHAQEPEERPERTYPRILFNGFGAFGLVHSTEEQADFQPNALQPDGPGFTDDVSFELDSRLAAQLTVELAPRLRAIVQVIAEERWDDNYGPTVEWANVAYGITPDFTVRAGRTALPAFMLSDFRKVGYAVPWVRPPVEMYSLVPVFNLDGVDATYRARLGEWTNTFNVSYGRAKSTFPSRTAEVETDALGVFNTLERGSLLLRFGIARGDLHMESVGEFFDLFRAFGPDGIAIADQYDANEKAMLYGALGASYDPGPWFVTAELGRIEVDAFVGNRNAWYVGGGARLGPLTPYALYSGTVATSETSAEGLDVSGLPPEQAQMAAGLNAGLNEMLAGKPQQHTGSIGVRWDFMRNVAFKVQIDRIDILEGSHGTFTNLQPGYEPGRAVWLFNAGTAFVF